MRFSKEIKHLIRSAKIKHFPVGLLELKQIIETYGWEIYTYKDAADIIENYNLKDMANKNDSFATRVSGRTIIFYDDNISQLDFPYILAHEIGHVTLNHLDNTEDIYIKERDCNDFAEELLSYAPRFKFNTINIIAVTLAVLIAGVFGVYSFNRYQKEHTYVFENSIDIEPSNNTQSDTSSIETNSNSEFIVFITEYGEKYHVAGCRYIEGKENLLEVSIAQAENAGYEPCEICIGE